jgi:hypothetical protein
MSIQAPYSITFTPEGGSREVLAGVGSWLARLPEFSGEQEIYETDGVNLEHAFFRPLGGAVWSLVVEVEKSAATYTCLAGMLAGGDLFHLMDVEGALAFEPPDEEAAPTVFSPAVIRQIIPGLPSGKETTLVTRYHILSTIPTL